MIMAFHVLLPQNIAYIRMQCNFRTIAKKEKAKAVPRVKSKQQRNCCNLHDNCSGSPYQDDFHFRFIVPVVKHTRT